MTLLYWKIYESKGHFRQGPRSKVQWNWAFLLVKSFKLVSSLLDNDPSPRQIKLWFSLYAIIFEKKPIGSDQKKSLNESSWFGESKCMLRSRLFFFSFFFALFYCYFLSLLFKFCENGKHAMNWRHCWEQTNSLIFYQF
jgi:hypothetical protein